MKTRTPSTTFRRRRTSRAALKPGPSPHDRHITITEDFLAEVERHRSEGTLETLLTGLQRLAKSAGATGGMWRDAKYEEQAVYVRDVAIPAGAAAAARVEEEMAVTA